jgi:hypothetical protein
MEDVSIKGLVIAIIVALLLNTLGGVAGVSLFAEAMTQESVLAIEKQTHFLFFAFVVGLFATFAGGYISAKFGKLAPYRNATIFGVIGAVLGLMLATFDPLWFDFLGIILVVPVAILGGYVVARKNT